MKRIAKFFSVFLFLFLCRLTFSQSFDDFFKKGVNALNNRKYNAAVAYFSKAMDSPTRTSNPRLLSDVYNLRGAAYTELREYKKAQKDLETAKSRNTREQ